MESKALRKSTKATYNLPFLRDRYLLITVCKIKILSVVRKPFLKPACSWQKKLTASAQKLSLFNKTPENTLHMTEMSEIPR